jgi:outer membrane protein TolC
MLFTDYFDKIYLVNNYTDLFWQEKKLKRIEELAQNSSKQIQRHNRQIQKKYGKGKSSLTK